MATLASVSIFAADIDTVARFYQAVFGFSEVEPYRTPIFRALDARPALLAIHAHDARELLGLAAPGAVDGTRVSGMLNFEVDSRDEVALYVARAVDQGATLLKAPFATYYGAFQAVLADPEGNVFRVNRMPD
jgi:catechol 2,3-dioxygenase-like lactoylglutathione lyase family enzyme